MSEVRIRQQALEDAARMCRRLAEFSGRMKRDGAGNGDIAKEWWHAGAENTLRWLAANLTDIPASNGGGDV